MATLYSNHISVGVFDRKHKKQNIAHQPFQKYSTSSLSIEVDVAVWKMLFYLFDLKHAVPVHKYAILAF